MDVSKIKGLTLYECKEVCFNSYAIFKSLTGGFIYIIKDDKQLELIEVNNINEYDKYGDYVVIDAERHDKWHIVVEKCVDSFNCDLMNDGGERINYGEGKAFREPTTGKGRYDLISPFALRRLAEWTELGSHKYAPRNWEKGMPFSRYTDSAMRHLQKFIMGMEDEDHLAAAMWNIHAIIHHQEVGQTDLDDMPHYLSTHK